VTSERHLTARGKGVSVSFIDEILNQKDSIDHAETRAGIAPFMSNVSISLDLK